MLKFTKTKINELANRLTSNSELFGDEVASVTVQLVELSNSANKFGCPIEGVINDCWGNSIPVTAMPDMRKHSWSF